MKWIKMFVLLISKTAAEAGQIVTYFGPGHAILTLWASSLQGTQFPDIFVNCLISSLVMTFLSPAVHIDSWSFIERNSYLFSPSLPLLYIDRIEISITWLFEGLKFHFDLAFLGGKHLHHFILLSRNCLFF